MSDDRVDADLLGAPASDPIRRRWDIQDAAARATVTRRNTEACKAALSARRRDWQSAEVPEGEWVMAWRRFSPERAGWYGPGLHLAKSSNNRSHWVNMGARLWKCSREQLRLATSEESLSKEVAMALSREALDEARSGRPARFVDLTQEENPPEDAFPDDQPLAPDPSAPPQNAAT